MQTEEFIKRAEEAIRKVKEAINLKVTFGVTDGKHAAGHGVLIQITAEGGNNRATYQRFISESQIIAMIDSGNLAEQTVIYLFNQVVSDVAWGEL